MTTVPFGPRPSTHCTADGGKLRVQTLPGTREVELALQGSGPTLRFPNQQAFSYAAYVEGQRFLIFPDLIAVAFTPKQAWRLARALRKHHTATCTHQGFRYWQDDDPDAEATTTVAAVAGRVGSVTSFQPVVSELDRVRLARQAGRVALSDQNHDHFHSRISYTSPSQRRQEAQQIRRDREACRRTDTEAPKLRALVRGDAVLLPF